MHREKALSSPTSELDDPLVVDGTEPVITLPLGPSTSPELADASLAVLVPHQSSRGSNTSLLAGLFTQLTSFTTVLCGEKGVDEGHATSTLQDWTSTPTDACLSLPDDENVPFSRLFP